MNGKNVLTPSRNEEWLDAQTRRTPAGQGYGVDVASQRADGLDDAALAFLQRRFEEWRFLQHEHHRPTALDIACGAGGQALRMAAQGAVVTAVDCQDHSQAITLAAHTQNVWQPPTFVQADMRALPAELTHAPFDVICCQRALHYLPYAEALATLKKWIPLFKRGGRLFVSVSGLPSELGQGYPHAECPLKERFAPLAPAMAARHDIILPVCLYNGMDFADLLHAAGYGISTIYQSPFGNIKAVALV